MNLNLNFRDAIRTLFFTVKRFGFSFNSVALARKWILGSVFNNFSDIDHLQATISWLQRGHLVTNKNGISNVFFLNSGWGEAYPETSGYIVSTFLTYANKFQIPSLIADAVLIGDWEIRIQSPDGGIYSSELQKTTRVFNTGQVILGWCDLYEVTGSRQYLEAAIRGGEYLLKGQESDGSWVANTYCGARTYHSRVSWSLLRLFAITHDIRFRNAAEKNILWIIKNTNPNGWFSNCGFDNDLPNMHVISYTLQGLLECALMDADLEAKYSLLKTVMNSTDRLIESAKSNHINGIEGMIPGQFDHLWSPRGKSSCLTGNAQFAIHLYRLYNKNDNVAYLNYADRIIDSIKSTQILDSPFKDINGGVAGSYPFGIGYVNNGFPNWAAKFFCDALMYKMERKSSFFIKA